MQVDVACQDCVTRHSNYNQLSGHLGFASGLGYREDEFPNITKGAQFKRTPDTTPSTKPNAPYGRDPMSLQILRGLLRSQFSWHGTCYGRIRPSHSRQPHIDYCPMQTKKTVIFPCRRHGELHVHPSCDQLLLSIRGAQKAL